MSELVWEEGKESDGTPNIVAKLGGGREFCITGTSVLYIQMTRQPDIWIELCEDKCGVKSKAERIYQIIKEEL